MDNIKTAMLKAGLVHPKKFERATKRQNDLEIVDNQLKHCMDNEKRYWLQLRKSRLNFEII